MRLARALLAAVVLTGCGPSVPIRADREDYAPVMNSAPGLGLSAPAAPPKGTRWRWRTDFGRFVRWEAPDYKVVELGTEAAGVPKVYWTYDPSLMHQEKPVVHVTLEAVGPSGRAAAGSTLRLRWEGDAATIDRGLP